MSNIGDLPFDPTAYDFTVAEAARVSGVSEADIRNWMRRDVVPVGKKSRLGRIMFSALNIVQLRVIGDLNRMLGVDPSSANPIANQISDHCSAWMQRENAHLHQTKDGHRMETRMILNLGEDCATPSTANFEWGDTVFGFKVSERGEGDGWTRRPFMVFPVEQIFGDVLDELWAILESEEE